MATKTPNLGLIKPAFGEYTNSWNIPVNANMDTLDAQLGSSQTEIETARGTAADLNTRLSVALNPDGSFIFPAELATARVSQIYGAVDPITTFDNTIYNRMDQVDEEVNAGRQGAVNLSTGMANLSDDNVAANSILSAPTGYLTFTGAAVNLDGSTQNVFANINGFRQKVRSRQTTTITGAAGTYYITLSKTSGNQYATGTQGTTGVATGALLTQQFVDTTQNFITLGTQPGDILSITSAGSSNLNQYYVASVVNATTLLIYGVFQSVQSALTYTLTDPNAPLLGFTAIPHAKRFVSVPGMIYIGRAVFDGTNVTTLIPYALRGVFEEFVSVNLVGGAFTSTISHNLGYLPSKLFFAGTQASDYSGNVNPLAIDSGTTSARAVTADMTDLITRVRNSVNGVFYTDFDGNVQTTGYLLVRAER